MKFKFKCPFLSLLPESTMNNIVSAYQWQCRASHRKVVMAPKMKQVARFLVLFFQISVCAEQCSKDNCSQEDGGW